jgi:chlorobactene glucosyltransferase
MSTALQAFVLFATLELLIWLPPLWGYRAGTARSMMVFLAVSTAWLFITSPTFLVGLLVCLAVFRLVNLGRVVYGRVNTNYLQGVSWRTAWWFAVMEAITLGLWWGLHALSITQALFWDIVLFAQLVISVALFVTTLRHLKTTRPPRDIASLSTKQLPALTVAVPARNETDDLEACLESLVANDYPKLEILVYDDCSQNTRTPEIIRSFAHDGVKFIAGQEIDENWLPKNYAYQRLVEESSGELILFCGVDARFESDSLRRLVETMLQKNKSMISIMPRNILPKHLRSLSMLVQPMRYAWEIALPRKLFRRPPVLSTCWIIQRSLLDSSGSFRAVTRSIVPESYFARVAVVHDGYSLMQSDNAIGITCAKDISEQHDTATRTKYPQLHRRPELVFLLTMGELMSLILPLAFVLASLATPSLRLFALLSASTTLLLVAWYCAVVSLVYRRFVLRSLLALPFAVVHDVAVLNYSMLKYEFSVVLWKGRNVCVPVMRVEPRLPKV